MNSDSLVIMDELGSGTDPAEGMGIAVAILEELKKSGANFLVTTHYPEIKEYAEDYYDNFAVWSVAPNRKNHIPYVMKALTLDESEIEEVLICRAGRN